MSSLRFAGVEMAHVPRRATQHGCFLSNAEVPPTTLKPGQTHLRERQLYTEEAEPQQESYMKGGMASESVYKKDVSSLTQPVHYMEPTKPIKQVQPNIEGGHHDVSHWRSEYKSVHSHTAVHGATYHRQYGPSYQGTNPVSCVSRPDDATSYHEEYGKHGSDPRDKIDPYSDKMPVFKSALTRGTTKATAHIPGYQGFLATNTTNPYVARVEKGGNVRSLDKHVLTEQYNTNLVGYQGHRPNHAKNDNGGMRASTVTTSGKDFQTPALNVFPTGQL
jgi:hypothetical protein